MNRAIKLADRKKTQTGRQEDRQAGRQAERDSIPV